MKKLPLLFTTTIALALLFSSCLKDKTGIKTETITEGSKWGLQIGSAAADTYLALQQLDNEKEGKIGYVAFYGKHTFDTPEEIRSRLLYYNAVSLQSPESVINRAVIIFDAAQVTSVSVGGALLDEVPKWPQDVAEEVAIRKDDPVETLYTKIAAIHSQSAYNKYQISLPEKILSKAFDPELANIEQWSFGFQDSIAPGKAAMNNATLYFSEGKLLKILTSYREGDIYD